MDKFVKKTDKAEGQSNVFVVFFKKLIISKMQFLVLRQRLFTSDASDIDISAKSWVSRCFEISYNLLKLRYILDSRYK